MKIRDPRSRKDLLREVEGLQGVIRATAARLGMLGKFTVAKLLLRADQAGALLAVHDRQLSPESGPAESGVSDGAAD